MVPAGNKGKRLSSVNQTTKTIQFIFISVFRSLIYVLITRCSFSSTLLFFHVSYDMML